MSTTPNDPNQPGSSDPSGAGPTYGSTPQYGDSSKPAYASQQPAYGEQAQPAYGAPSDPAYGAPAGYVPARPSSTMAVVALVLGILALLGSWIPFVNIVSLLMGIVGAIVGFMALSRIKKGTASGRGLALGGVITSILAILISVVVVVGAIALIGNSTSTCDPNTMTDQEYSQCLIDNL